MNTEDLKNQFIGSRTEKVLEKIAGELENLNETLIIISQQLPAIYDFLANKESQ